MAPTAETSAPRLAYLPALDGVRGVLICVIMLFHAGFAFVAGGFLTVSVFFTLSGYLITSLLLAERHSSGRVSLGDFWRRRFRRLLPAALACFAFTLLYGFVAATPAQRAELGGDMVASALYVANWWFIASGQSYADLFEAPSAMLQFWSLAIEEQFYLVFPLVVIAALWRLRPGAAQARMLVRVGAVLGGMLVVTLVVLLVGDWSQDWRYYATPARMPELLTGALAAVVLSSGTRRQRLMDASGRVVVALSIATTVGVIAVMGVLMVTSTQASAWVYEGGFAAFSLLSVALILALHVRAAPTTWLLGRQPLRHIGQISYGLYLFHWPIFLWLDPVRTGLDGWPLFGVRMVATFAVAELSWHLVEKPLRRTGRLRLPRLAPVPMVRWAPPLSIALLAGALLASSTATAPPIDFVAAERQLQAAQAESLRVVPLPEQPDPAERPNLRVGVFGDSAALMTASGVGEWAVATPGVEWVSGVTRLGCGLSLAAERRLLAGPVGKVDAFCRSWPQDWSLQARSNVPNVAVVQVGPWDILDRRNDPAEAFSNLGDPETRAVVLNEMLTAVDLLNDEGALVVWLTSPMPNKRSQNADHRLLSSGGEGWRLEMFNDMIRELPGLRPGGVEVVELGAWHESIGEEEDWRLRPDGLHLSVETSLEVASTFLGVELDRVIEEALEAGTFADLTRAAVARASATPPLASVPDGVPLRVVVWGDVRVAEVAAAMPTMVDGHRVDPVVVAAPGCAVGRLDRRRDYPSPEARPSPECVEGTAMAEAIADHDPHVVVIAADWPADLAIGDMDYFSPWLNAEFSQAVDGLRFGGARVVVVNLPHVDPELSFGNSEAQTVNIVWDILSRSPSRSDWMAIADVRPGVDLTPTDAISEAISGLLADQAGRTTR
jgi:peptidoglycan/LPS O-acetylase OafA/YrhL